MDCSGRYRPGMVAITARYLVFGMVRVAEAMSLPTASRRNREHVEEASGRRRERPRCPRRLARGLPAALEARSPFIVGQSPSAGAIRSLLQFDAPRSGYVGQRSMTGRTVLSTATGLSSASNPRCRTRVHIRSPAAEADSPCALQRRYCPSGGWASSGSPGYRGWMSSLRAIPPGE
jgi:hypothetical protein